MAEPLARSPIAAPPPLAVAAGWQVTARRATGDLAITDCTPLTKVAVRAAAAGAVAAGLGVPFGRAARGVGGALVVGSAPGEWLLLDPPGQGAALIARIGGLAVGEFATAVDLTHGRALVRLTGSRSADVLAKVCGIDLADEVTPDGAALRSAVAGLATEIVRDDRPAGRSYLLHCERSAGQYLFDALLRSGAGFGIEIDGFTPPGL